MNSLNDDQVYKDFSSWYKEVCLDCTPEILQMRFDSMSNLLNDLTWKDIESMLRIVFKTKQKPSNESIKLIGDAFKAQDETFEFNRNQREVEILCGAALSTLCNIDNTLSPITTLGVLNASMNGSRSPECPIDLVSIAKSSMRMLSESVRKRPDMEIATAKMIQNINAELMTKKIPETFDGATASAIFLELIKAVNTNFQSLHVRTSNIVNELSNYLGAQDEELQMLWWLIGGRSWDLNCEFSEVPSRIKPLILANELASLTVFCPGRVSTKALLTKAGIDDTGVLTLKDAVNSCEIAWIKSLIGEHDYSPVTLPIHSALKCRLDTEDQDSWADYWGASTKILPESSHSGLTLGFQFYCERLLLKFTEATS